MTLLLIAAACAAFPFVLALALMALVELFARLGLIS